MKGQLKPLKVRVYWNELKAIEPGWSIFDQFALGHFAWPSKSASVGSATESGPTASWPFVLGVRDCWSGEDGNCVLTATVLPPLLVQVTVADQVAVRSSTALVFPTPPMVYEEQDTPLGVTRQLGAPFACAPDGPHLLGLARPSKGVGVAIPGAARAERQTMAERTESFIVVRGSGVVSSD